MANPTLTVSTTNYAAQGFNRLTWTNATKGASWYSWRIYRRTSIASGKWKLIKEILYDTASYTYDDYLATSNIGNEYVVVRVYLVAFVPTEEAKAPLVTVTPASDHFWLIHPYNGLYNMLLLQVTSDDISLEADVGEMQVIERGRRVDHGTVWGRRGSVTCQVRGATAEAQLDAFEAAFRARSYYWFRNPFKEMTKVMITDLAIKRIPGSGLNEYADVSFSYAELAA